MRLSSLSQALPSAQHRAVTTAPKAFTAALGLCRLPGKQQDILAEQPHSPSSSLVTVTVATSIFPTRAPLQWFPRGLLR